MADDPRAEVLSPNEKPRVLELKREFHTGHAHCRGVMFIRQDRFEAELMVREGDNWQAHTLTDPTAGITIPVIGAIGTLADLYRGTPLALRP